MKFKFLVSTNVCWKTATHVCFCVVYGSLGAQVVTSSCDRDHKLWLGTHWKCSESRGPPTSFLVPMLASLPPVPTPHPTFTPISYIPALKAELKATEPWEVIAFSLIPSNTSEDLGQVTHSSQSQVYHL